MISPSNQNNIQPRSGEACAYEPLGMKRSPSSLYMPLGDCMVCGEELLQWVGKMDQEHNAFLKMKMGEEI